MTDSAFVADFEIDLRKALESRLNSRERPVPRNLADSIRYSLLSAGKRIRPRLLLTTGAMLGLGRTALVPPAVALEMIHCFTLIHDDLPCMDDDDVRRGKPSNHKVFGEALALLAGDGLIPLAFEICSEAAPHVAPPAFVAALKRLAVASGPQGVIGGQAAEPLLTPESPFEALSEMHLMKTGALFEAAILLPMDLAGIMAASESGAALGRFARALGLAFQTADDLHDAIEERNDPTNILRYLSADEAAGRAATELRAGCAELSRLWRDGAEPLLAIAEQVLDSLGEGLKSAKV